MPAPVAQNILSRLAQLKPQTSGLLDAAWGHALVEVLMSFAALQINSVVGGSFQANGLGRALIIDPPNLRPVYQAIQDETDRAEAAEADLAAAISSEISRAEAAEAVLAAALAAEVARATAAEVALEAEIVAEVARAENAEADLEVELLAGDAALEAELLAGDAVIEAQILEITGNAGYGTDPTTSPGALGDALFNLYNSAGNTDLADLGADIYALYNNAGYASLPALGFGVYDLYNNAGGGSLTDLAGLGSELFIIFDLLNDASKVDQTIYDDACAPTTGQILFFP